MFDTTRRRFLVGSLASLFAAPALVRATSLDLAGLRGERFAASGITYDTADSLAYEYWAIGPNGLAKYTAKQIMDAPSGVFLPWLPTERVDGSRGIIHGGSFRPVREKQNGLMFSATRNDEKMSGFDLQVRNLADSLDRDPVIAKLRSEQDDLLRRLRAVPRNDAERAFDPSNNEDRMKLVRASRRMRELAWRKEDEQNGEPGA
jgi:hypothetical protein